MRLPSTAWHLLDRAEEIADDVDRMGAVVDQHAAAAICGIGVPAPRHVDARREGVLEQDDLAEDAGGHQALGPDHVVDVAELRGHGEHDARAAAASIIRAASPRCDGQRLLAEHVMPAREKGRQISGWVAGGVQTITASTLASSASFACESYAGAADAFGQRLGRLGPHVGDGRDARRFAATQRLRVRLGDGAGTDQAEPHWLALHDRTSATAARISPGQCVDVLLGVALVPRQDEDALERLEGAGEALRRVVDRLRSRQGERPAAVAEGALVAKDLALEGRLLDVARRRGDAAFLEPSPQFGRATRDHVRVDAQAVLPVDVLVAGRHPWRLDAGDALQQAGQSQRHPLTLAHRALELLELGQRHRALQLGHAVVERQEVVVGLRVAVAPGLVDEQERAARELRVVGHDDAALAGGDVLALLQAEAADGAERADWLAVDAGKRRPGHSPR